MFIFIFAMYFSLIPIVIALKGHFFQIHLSRVRNQQAIRKKLRYKLFITYN